MRGALGSNQPAGHLHRQGSGSRPYLLKPAPKNPNPPEPRAQVAPDRVRGALGSINQLVICIGIVAALVVNVMVPAEAWRSMFLLATVPAAALGLGATACQLASTTCLWLHVCRVLVLCGN